MLKTRLFPLIAAVLSLVVPASLPTEINPLVEGLHAQAPAAKPRVPTAAEQAAADKVAADKAALVKEAEAKKIAAAVSADKAAKTKAAADEAAAKKAAADKASADAANAAKKNQTLLTKEANEAKAAAAQAAAEATTAAKAAADADKERTDAEAKAAAAAEKLKPFFAQSDMASNARLLLSRDWAANAAAVRIDGEPVVSIDVIRNLIGFTTDPAIPRTNSVLEADPKSLDNLARVSIAMNSVAEKFGTDSDPDLVIAAWDDAKNAFIAELAANEPPANIIPGKVFANRPKEAWSTFLDAWQIKALTADKTQFRQALIQAPVIMAGLLIGFEKDHIAAVLSGGSLDKSGSSNLSGSGSAGSSGGSGRISHLTIHHTRTMNRIVERHARRMNRIGN